MGDHWPHTEVSVNGTPEPPSVLSDGSRLAPTIDGVRVERVITHADHRGRLFEVVNHAHEFWAAPVVQTYVFTVRPGAVKGWGVHDGKDDRYCLISGELLVLLYDGRGHSPTSGLVQEVFLSPDCDRLLLIPRGVWHLSLNVGTEMCVGMNHPTVAYNYAEPDKRLMAWDDPSSPVDVRRYLRPQVTDPTQ